MARVPSRPDCAARRKLIAEQPTKRVVSRRRRWLEWAAILAVPAISAVFLLNEVLYWRYWRARADEAIAAFYAERREMPREQWSAYAPLIEERPLVRDAGEPAQWFKQTPLIREYIGPWGDAYWDAYWRDYCRLAPSIPELRSAPVPDAAFPIVERRDSGLPNVQVFGQRGRMRLDEVVRALLIDSIRQAMVNEDPDAALGSLLAAYKCHRAVLLGNHLHELIMQVRGLIPMIDAVALRLCAEGVFEPRELRAAIMAVMPDVPNNLSTMVGTHGRAIALRWFWSKPDEESDLVFRRGDCEIVDRLIDDIEVLCEDLNSQGAVYKLREYRGAYSPEPDTVPAKVRVYPFADIIKIASCYRFAADYHRCTLEVLRLWEEGEAYEFVWETRRGSRSVELLPPPKELLAIFDVRQAIEIGEGRLKRVMPGG